jgi:hypothetical protein
MPDLNHLCSHIAINFFHAMYALWEVMPYIMVGCNQHSGGTCCLHLETEEIEDMLITIYQTARRLIPQDSYLHNHLRENFRSGRTYIFKCCFIFRANCLATSTLHSSTDSLSEYVLLCIKVKGKCKVVPGLN